MLSRTVAVSNLVLAFTCWTILASGFAFGQQKPAAAGAAGAQEFPITMQQNVTAGKTPIGTKVQAKLRTATLLNGTVIPRNAVLSGEVVESTAKSENSDSRLSIRMDSANWKNGTAAVLLYLTAWYYPTREALGQDLQYGPTQPANRTWNGAGAYPDPNSKVYKPFPEGDSDKGGSVPDTPSSTTSNHRSPIPDMQAVRGDNGAIAVVSHRSNIKLDKLTTYVLVSGEPTAATAK
jgi:hypothetical protein